MRFNHKKIISCTFGAMMITTLGLVAQEPVPAPDKPTSDMRRAVEWKRFEYTCEDGQKLNVFLHNGSVKVQYKGNRYFMKQVPSADGEKYSDGKVVWWGKGNGGFLQEDSADGNGAMIVKDCKLDKPLNSDSSKANTVTGTVIYRVRMALPPTAVIEVMLQDVSLADAPAKTLADEKITLGERQVPIPFSLTFDPAKVEQNHTYSLRARILVDGQLRFISDKSYPVITRGNSNQAEIVVTPVTAPGTSKP